MIVNIIVFTLFGVSILLVILGAIFNCNFDDTPEGDLIMWYGRKERKHITLIRHNNLL